MNAQRTSGCRALISLHPIFNHCAPPKVTQAEPHGTGPALLSQAHMVRYQSCTNSVRIFLGKQKALYAPITWGSQHSSPAERGDRSGDSVFCSATEQTDTYLLYNLQTLKWSEQYFSFNISLLKSYLY
jgi:hypothetical protein